MFSGSGANGTTYRIKVTVSDAAGNLTSATSSANFAMDSVVPVSTAASMTVNGSVSGAATSNNYVQLSYRASDGQTNLTHFCFKYNVSAQPTLSDSCWISVSASPPGLTPGLSLNLSNYAFPIGLTTGLYSIYAWTHDSAGNISTLTNSGSGTSGTDLVSISYTTPVGPTLINVIGTSSATPNEPTQNALDLTINAGTDVYIQWKISSAPNGLGSNPISLSYSSNNTSFTPIVSGIANGSNGCTPDAYHTGCYKWVTGSPSNSFFAIRVVVQDNLGMATSATTPAINTWPPISFLAGATDPGTNGAASSASFISYSGTTLDPQSFVVTTNGTIYFRDRYRGILKVDPTTGNQTILIPMTTAAFTDGALASATVTSPSRLALDFQDRLLIQDLNAIRRFDPLLSTVSTIVGGPSATQSAATTTASTTRIITNTPTGASSVGFFSVPDGRIIFATETTSAYPNIRIRTYNPVSSQVTSTYLTGLGNSNGPTTDLTLTANQFVFAGYDSTTSNLDTLWASMCQNGVCQYTATFNPATGVNTGGPYPAYGFSVNGIATVTGMNGEIYGFTPSGYIKKYNKSTLNWTTLAGNGTTGTSIDGATALTSPIVAQDLFVNAASQIYFFERGKIRLIDQNGKIQTAAGFSRSFGDGGNALSARIGDVTDFKIWNNGSGDRITFMDNSELKFRQFPIGGNITTLAGNGVSASPNNTTSASTQAINWMPGGQYNTFLFQVNPSNGDLYASPRGSFVSLLPQSTGIWTDVIGTSSGSSYMLADGMAGNQINNVGYQPQPIGFDGSNLLITRYRYASTYVDSMLKLHSVASAYTQSAFAGITGNSSAPGTICAIGTPLTSCLLPSAGGGTGELSASRWDSYGNQWAVMMYRYNKVYSMVSSGNLGLIATLPNSAYAFDYRHDVSHNIIYYCSTTDAKLHSYNVATSTDSTYAWPVPGLQCGSHSLIYSASRNSLIFAYSLNGLYGIAEYLSP